MLASDSHCATPFFTSVIWLLLSTPSCPTSAALISIANAIVFLGLACGGDMECDTTWFAAKVVVIAVHIGGGGGVDTGV